MNDSQKEDMLNGGLGFSGSNPVIQVAGKERLIEKDPRELLASGNYTTDVPVLLVILSSKSRAASL